MADMESVKSFMLINMRQKTHHFVDFDTIFSSIQLKFTVSFINLFKRFIACCFASIVSVYAGNISANPEMLDQGISSFQAGNYDQALAQLQQAIQQEPQSSRAFFYYGLAAAKQKRHAKAAAALKRSLVLKPKQPEASLALGMSYYQLGLYNLATVAFQEAAAYADQSSGTAWFFLGLSSQRQAQYEQSIDAFQRAYVADTDYSQSAWYHIGLSRQAIGQNSLALTAFKNAEHINTDPEITALARDAMQRKTVEEVDMQKPWELSVRAGFEYDDNVTVSQTDTTTFLDDYAAVFDVSANYELVDTEENNVQVSYDFYQSVYGELSEFDLQSHRFGVTGSHESDMGIFGMDYGYSYITLGGDSFFETHSVMPSVSYLPLSSWYLNIFYNYTDKNFFNNDPRDAHQHAIGFDNYLFFADNQAYAYLGYRVENEITSGSEFSYLGNYVTTNIHAKFPQYILEPEFGIGYKYFVKDYDNVTPSIDQVRQDRRHTVNMLIDLHLSRTFTGRLEYQYINAISNLPSSDFKENIFSFSLGASF